MIAFGTSFGVGLGLDYIADLVNEYGAEIIASNTCNGDQRLKASYEKTFLFVGAIATKYGIKSVTKAVPGVKERVVRVFDHGKFWDSKFDIQTRNRFGDMARKYHKRTHRNIRFDEDGFGYEFDKMHRTEKVHLHKYRNVGGDKWKLIEEIDPETGELMKVVKDGKIEQW